MRDVARRTAPLTKRHPAARTLVTVLVLTVALGTPGTGQAARPEAGRPNAGRPNVEAAAQFLAQRNGGAPSDFALVYELSARAPGGETLWAGKLVDRRSGRVTMVYRDAHGSTGGPELLHGLERAAQARLTAVERKAGASLRQVVAERAASRDNSRLPVAIWLTADVGAAEQAVIDRHPEVSWLAGRPVTNQLAVVRALRGQMWLARRSAYAAAGAALERRVVELGGRVAYASTSAPLVFVDLPARAVAALAERADVESMGLEGTWQPAMSAAGPAVDANWISGGGDRGTGIRVAVVEYHNVRRGGQLGGKVVKSHSTSGSLAYTRGGTFDHPTWVAGAIAGQSTTYRGVAPGASIVSSGTGGYRASLAYDRRIIRAADWAIGPARGDADIVNTSLVQDTATGAEEARRYFDSIVDQDGRLAISAAGNYVNFNGWQIGSPGTGYNVLTVGGVDDRGTARRGDDRLWYVPGSNGSNWFDRPGDRWNTHGDYNKPNLVAPAVRVRTANGLAASGTSVATPIVSGVAAQLLANEPQLAAWPEAARAVLMAGAIRRVPMPNGSRNVDHEGVGMTSAYWTNLIARSGDNQFGGYRLGSLQAGDEPRQQISVRSGDRLRVALAWNSHTGGSSNLSKIDRLRADLDLRVTAPDGSRRGSYTVDNSYEFVEFLMPTTGVASIDVLQTRFDGRSETYGLAWAKVRDSKPPSTSIKVPASGEPWAVPTTQVRAVFNEPVLGLDEQSFTLRRVSTGQGVAADVTYSSSTKSATLRPQQPMAAGWYEARLAADVTDRAGNALPAKRWSFRVMRAGPGAEGSLDRRATLKEAVHTGYRFDADGGVVASKSINVGSASRVEIDRRLVQPGLPGHWLRVASGRLSGYWLRESSEAGLIGKTGGERFDSDRRVILRAGTHVGRRFNGASMTGSKSYRTSATVKVTASERAVINGSWRLRISSGALAGYWVTESSVAFLPGAVQLTDLDTGRAAVTRGTRTAHRFYESGSIRSSKSASISSRQRTLVAAWAVVNGRPRFYVLRWHWAAYWLSESSSVHLP